MSVAITLHWPTPLISSSIMRALLPVFQRGFSWLFVGLCVLLIAVLCAMSVTMVTVVNAVTVVTVHASASPDEDDDTE